MKKNNVIIYVVIGILAVALLGGIMDLSKQDETSVSATNILNNTKTTSIFTNSFTTNKIKENIIENEESQDTETSSNVKTTSTQKPKQETTVKKETSSTAKTSTSTNSSKQTNSKTSASSSSSTSSVSKANDETSETVWVGKTGTKYHRQSCRTLKGKGHKITLKEALAEGREPCKVCKP